MANEYLIFITCMICIALNGSASPLELFNFIMIWNLVLICNLEFIIYYGQHHSNNEHWFPFMEQTFQIEIACIQSAVKSEQKNPNRMQRYGSPEQSINHHHHKDTVHEDGLKCAPQQSLIGIHSWS
eukprot:127417_1